MNQALTATGGALVPSAVQPGPTCGSPLPHHLCRAPLASQGSSLCGFGLGRKPLLFPYEPTDAAHLVVPRSLAPAVVLFDGPVLHLAPLFLFVVKAFYFLSDFV